MSGDDWANTAIDLGMVGRLARVLGDMGGKGALKDSMDTSGDIWFGSRLVRLGRAQSMSCGWRREWVVVEVSAVQGRSVSSVNWFWESLASGRPDGDELRECTRGRPSEEGSARVLASPQLYQ